MRESKQGSRRGLLRRRKRRIDRRGTNRAA